MDNYNKPKTPWMQSQDEAKKRQMEQQITGQDVLGRPMVTNQIPLSIKDRTSNLTPDYSNRIDAFKRLLGGKI